MATGMAHISNVPRTIADIMQAHVITVTPATPLVEFARIVAEDRISGAPVVQVDGRLVGLVSKTDLVERMLADDPKFGMAADRENSKFDSREVQDIMSDSVLTVAENTPLADVAARMVDDHVHRVVVMRDDKIAGIVTSLDLLAHFPRHA